MKSSSPRALRSGTLLIALLLSVSPAVSGTVAAAVPPGPVTLMAGSSLARAIFKYFGKEGTEEATEYLARQGGREVTERVAAAAMREGGQEAADQVSRLAAKYGPEALTALDNVPQLKPVLAALDELPEAQARAALARLSAGTAGRELAESVSRVGAAALRSELKHPGVGAMLTRTLGDDGAELASRLSGEQTVAVARHADDLAALPSAQRRGVLALLREDSERMVRFLGRFAADNPGKTLFTVATTTVLLAESDRILGGEEITFDAQGNPVVVRKAGLMGRTMQAGGEVLQEVSDGYLKPLYLAGLVFLVTFVSLFLVSRLFHRPPVASTDAASLGTAEGGREA